MKSSLGIALFCVSFLLNQYNVDADCTALTAPTGGTLSSTAVAATTEVTLTCANSVLSGEGTTTCTTANGADSWVPALGTCTTDCPVLTAPSGGTLSSTAVATTTEVTLTCDDDSAVTGTATVTCTNGAWVGTLGTCGSAEPDVTTEGGESADTTESSEDSGSINPALNKLIIMNVIIAILGFMYI